MLSAVQRLSQRFETGAHSLGNGQPLHGESTVRPLGRTDVRESREVERLRSSQAALRAVLGRKAAGLPQLDRVENRAQIAYADRMLLTKCDLAGPAAQNALRERLNAVNPRARMLPVGLHRNDLKEVLLLLFDARAYSFDCVAPDELARMRAPLNLLQPTATSDASQRLRPLGAGLHTEDVVSCVFESEQALDLERFNVFLDAAVQRFGVRLWRCKGIVCAEHQRQRLVVQGVQSLLQIKGWSIWRPHEPRRTVLVFIGQCLDRQWILAALHTCEAGYLPATG